ncbi:muramidase family protein, partial [Alkalibacterium psychrotolerans]
NNTTVTQLRDWNNLENADRIFVGQRLVISAQKEEAPKLETPAPTPAEPAKPGEASYTVKAGDTLSGIARTNNTTVTQLRDWNNLENADRIFIGQRLIVSSQKEEAPQPETSVPKPAKPVEASYTVKAGDTLSGIARTNNTTVTQLRDWNDLENADRIFIGQRLIVSSQKEEAPKPVVPAPTPAEPAKPGEANYTVKSGDTLSGIARTNNTTVTQLRDWNDLENADRIFIGQRLIVSSQKEEAPKPETPSPKPAEPVKPTEASYTVKAGDTLSGIARTHNTTVAQLQEWNSLKSDIIFVNQKLSINNQLSAKPVIEEQRSVHTVSLGDTLSHIARQYSLSVRELKELNHLTSDLIFVNQKLTVKK